jgi:hypothetical protein
VDAAVEVRDRALDAGAEGVGAARQLGDATLDRARSVTGRVTGGIAERARRRRVAAGEDADGRED